MISKTIGKMLDQYAKDVVFIQDAGNFSDAEMLLIETSFATNIIAHCHKNMPNKWLRAEFALKIIQSLTGIFCDQLPPDVTTIAKEDLDGRKAH